MVSKAREDLPEPDSPVTTVRVLRGMETSTLRRLCWRAPRTVMCVMPMEVVWRCSAKSLEYGIWGQERYGRGEGVVGQFEIWFCTFRLVASFQIGPPTMKAKISRGTT